MLVEGAIVALTVATPDQDELPRIAPLAKELPRLEQSQQVLFPRQAADVQDVALTYCVGSAHARYVGVGGRAVAGSIGGMHDGDASRVEAVDADQIVRRSARDGDDAICPAQRARLNVAPVKHVREGVEVWMQWDGHVIDGNHGTARKAPCRQILDMVHQIDSCTAQGKGPDDLAP